MAKCSFSKVSLKDIIPQYWEFGTDMFARLFYVSGDDNEILMTVLDFADSYRKTAAKFRELVSQKTGIPDGNIWYHELQLHAASGSEINHQIVEALAEKVSAEVENLRKNAVSFKCEVTEAYAGTKFSYNREQYVHGLGGVTVWAGLKYDENGKPYSQDPGRMLLRGYEPNLPVFEKPIYFDNPNDPLAYLFVFKDENDKIIGTISRFAAHPDVAVLFESHHVSDYKFNFDWPGYLSEYLEKELGAVSVYFNGPCANLAMKKGFEGFVTYEKSAAEAKRIGEELGEFLLAESKKKKASLGNADNCRSARFEIELPIRENLADNVEELLARVPQDEERAEAELRNAIDSGELPSTVKTLIDNRYRATYNRFFPKIACAFDDENLSKKTALVDVMALELGDYLFVGVPGESMVEMTFWLRSTFTGSKTITLDQVNGYYSYMATPTSLTLGGYTTWYSWVNRDSIPKLKEEIVKAMEKFLG